MHKAFDWSLPICGRRMCLREADVTCTLATPLTLPSPVWSQSQWLSLPGPTSLSMSALCLPQEAARPGERKRSWAGVSPFVAGARVWGRLIWPATPPPPTFPSFSCLGILLWLPLLGPASVSTLPPTWGSAVRGCAMACHCGSYCPKVLLYRTGLVYFLNDLNLCLWFMSSRSLKTSWYPDFILI